MRVLFFCIAVFLSSQCAFAEETTPSSYVFKTRSDLNELILAMDVDAVEALFVQSDKALQDLGPTHAYKFRTLMGSFQVTNPDMDRFMDLWIKRYPKSVYQKIATGFRQIQIGWFYRGETVMRFISREARAAYESHFQKAAELAKETYEQRPDLVAAADLARQVHQMGYGWRPTKGLYYEILQNHRDVPSIKRSLIVLSAKWGGSVDLVFKTCEIFAPKAVADFPYNVDICKAAYVFEELIYRKHPDLYEWAFDVLDRTPIEAMISNRLTDLKMHRYEQEGGDELAAILFAEMKKKPKYLISLIRQGYVFSEHFNPFLKEMAEMEIPPVLTIDDVLSPKSVRREAGRELERISKEGGEYDDDWDNPKKYAVFNQILDKGAKYGKYSFEIYALRAMQFQNYYNLDTLVEARKTHETGIYYTNHMPVTLMKYKQMLRHFIYRVGFLQEYEDGFMFNGVDEGYDNVMEQLECPYFRASRLLEAICPAGVTSDACRYADNFGKLAADEDIEKHCPALADASLEELAFGLPK